ncbi:hypothetical protein SLEP1_g48421 [Rubroshorea leprosula]|uniref:Secreted protein n=1 Tax=Rubroshorea leprosula TaxID=152421 RepID=A0AAV5LTI8_9ROSI|nr:hypothetical protein SLEP1_g48421 [Rubroshorea leprosula]
MPLSSAARAGVLHHAFELGSSCLSSASCFWAWQLVSSSCFSTSQLMLQQFTARALADFATRVVAGILQLMHQHEVRGSCSSWDFTARAQARILQLVEIFILASCLVRDSSLGFPLRSPCLLACFSRNSHLNSFYSIVHMDVEVPLQAGNFHQKYVTHI